MSPKYTHEEILRHKMLKNSGLYTPKDQQNDFASSEISEKKHNSTSKHKVDNPEKKKGFISKLKKTTKNIGKNFKGGSNYGTLTTHTDLSLSDSYYTSTPYNKHTDIDHEDRISLFGDEFDATSFISDPHSISNDSGIDLSASSQLEVTNTDYSINLNIHQDEYSSIGYIDANNEEQNKASNHSEPIPDLSSTNGDKKINSSAITADEHNTLIIPERTIDSYSDSNIVDSKTQENSPSEELKIHSTISNLDSISNDSGIDSPALSKSQATSIATSANGLNTESYNSANYILQTPSTNPIKPILKEYSYIDIRPIRSSTPINDRILEDKHNNNFITSSNSAFKPFAQSGAHISPPNYIMVQADIHQQSPLKSQHKPLDQLHHSNTSINTISTDNTDHLLEANGPQSDYSISDLLDTNRSQHELPDKHGSHSGYINKNHSPESKNPFDDMMDDITDDYPAELNPFNTENPAKQSPIEPRKDLISDRTIISILNTPPPLAEMKDDYPAELNPFNNNPAKQSPIDRRKDLISDREFMSIARTPPPIAEIKEKKIKKSILHKTKSFVLHPKRSISKYNEKRRAKSVTRAEQIHEVDSLYKETHEGKRSYSATKVATPKITTSYDYKPVSRTTDNSPERDITEKKKSKNFGEGIQKSWRDFKEGQNNKKQEKQEKKERKAQLKAEQQDNTPNKNFAYRLGSFAENPKSSLRKSCRKTGAKFKKGYEQIKEKAPEAAQSACKAVGKGIKYMGVGVGSAIGGLFSGVQTGITKVAGGNSGIIGSMISKVRNAILISATFAIVGVCAVLSVEKARGELLDPKIAYAVMGICFIIGMLVSGPIVNGCKKIVDKCIPQQSKGGEDTIPNTALYESNTTNNAQNVEHSK